ncbi:ABC transporter ATP-binding protein [Polynucleobacter sp. MWH-CaK5]|uniref:ABC transporter ATP-binding protein n=1 Tax=Polynucleobacter sp. MWH-CaK5 TaxID=2689107 RepID=UPI001BFE61A8|nr:ABC transporter ATP-binding protein [Polynucleobacter sp. MWH-CaK5]QWD89159.1 ABC transporter ATP-binding protein [Polynucleobacter sp. MWH-CaK5]
MIIIMAFLDVIGVASIMPFMAVLANPKIIDSNQLLQLLYKSLGYETASGFLFFLGAAVFLLMVVSLVFKMFTNYALIRFSLMREHTLAIRLVKLYLNQSYDWFLYRNSANLGNTILSELNQVIGGAFIPLMQLISGLAVIAAMLLFLIFIDPVLTLMIFAFMGGVYIILYWLISSYLARIGERRLFANQQRFGILSEAFGGIKDIKVANLEIEYLKRFTEPSKIYAKYQSISALIGQLPRYFLEVIAFGGILLIILFLLKETGDVGQVLPIATLYALAGYRFMPALQQIYAASTSLKFTSASLDALYKDFLEVSKVESSILAPNSISRLVFKTKISINNVSYRYPQANNYALCDMTFDIYANTTVGLVGVSGSGKSTSVDLIMGLLEPSSGSVLVDDVTLSNQNKASWQKLIGYVPQQIFLADDSIASNIAFGVRSDLIDIDLLAQAAKMANLHDFIINELPNGYDTFVGERGVRLSGGQRQRIGIARALYRKPSILILDEATSALDNLTEQAVMDAVNQLSGRLTLILIAHRLSTVEKCDQLFVFDHGKIVAQGKFHDLVEQSQLFRSMVNRHVEI